jgi:hypothetical protein
LRRRLLNFVTVLSLLLCLAVMVLWVTSYLPEQFHLFSHKGRILLIFASKFRAHLLSEDEGRLPLDEVVVHISGYTAGEPGAVHGRFVGFEIALTERQYGFWFFAIPHWAVALPLAAGAAWGWWASRRRRRREQAGRCLQCGYDLRSSTDLCPECGTPVAQPAKALA